MAGTLIAEAKLPMGEAAVVLSASDLIRLLIAAGDKIAAGAVVRLFNEYRISEDSSSAVEATLPEQPAGELGNALNQLRKAGKLDSGRRFIELEIGLI